MAAENVNDFKSLDNTWTGEQTFSASPMITETILSTAPSATMVNKEYVDTTVGSVGEIVDAINNTKATVEQLPVLSYTLADHTLNSMDWKVSDGEWCDPVLYSTIFKHLTDDISNSESGISSEIVSALDKSTSWTVYYYAAKDGHKIVPCTYNDINQKVILDEIYNINEEAWYYCYDATSGFILPRKKFTTVDTMAELKAYVDEKISESKGYAFPDYSNIKTIKASGDAYDENGYTAPDNGWFVLNIHKSTSGGSVLIILNTYQVFWMTNPNNMEPVMVPVKKGTKLTLSYDTATGLHDERKICRIDFIAL